METQKNNSKPKYKVSLYYSRAHMPFGFASHGWFVTENDGITSRWDILFRKHASIESWGHLHKNYLPSTVGIEIIPYWTRFLWRGHFIGTIAGDDNSLAQRMVEFINDSYKNYPYRDRYSVFGPNSNTYPQWILNHFPEFGFKLPRNSFGKEYSS